MIDGSGWQRVEMDVGQAVGADDHRALLRAERVDELLQAVRSGIDIIGVELYDETAAERMVQCHVPCSAHADVVAVGYDVHETVVVDGVDSLCGTVGRVALRSVLHDKHIIFKGGLLAERTFQSVAYRADAVAYGNHDARLYGEYAFVEVDILELGSQVSPHSLEVLGAGLLHLYL